YLAPGSIADNNRIDATYVWWGTTDSSAIAARVFDHFDEQTAPYADFMPPSVAINGVPTLSASPRSLAMKLHPGAVSAGRLDLTNQGTTPLEFTIREATGASARTAARLDGGRSGGAESVDIPWLSVFPTSGIVGARR